MYHVTLSMSSPSATIAGQKTYSTLCIVVSYICPTCVKYPGFSTTWSQCPADTRIAPSTVWPSAVRRDASVPASLGMVIAYFGS